VIFFVDKSEFRQQMAIFYLVLKIETAQKIARHAVSIRVTP